MIVTAKKWRELVLVMRELELEKTKGTLKRVKGMWVWKQA
jgi:hypothetical protein